MGIQAKITTEMHPTLTQSPPAAVTHRPRLLCLLPTELQDCPNSTWMPDLWNTSKWTSSLVKLWYWNVLTNLTRSDSLYLRAALNTIREGSISALLYCWACRFLQSQLQLCDLDRKVTVEIWKIHILSVRRNHQKKTTFFFLGIISTIASTFCRLGHLTTANQEHVSTISVKYTR